MDENKGMVELEKLNEAVALLKKKMHGFKPLVSITLGSGLGHLAESLTAKRILSYDSIPNCPLPHANEHNGLLYWGKLGGVPVVMLQGRVHYYDYLDVHRAVFLTRVMLELGVKKLIITHAVGAVTKNLEPGDIVAVRSHIGYACPDPTAGLGLPLLGMEFPPMGEAYSKRLLVLAKECALETGVSLHWGVSYFKPGRTYESEAEVEDMRRSGADVATMSTVPEVISVAHMNIGAEVLDLALVANMGAGLGSGAPLSHKEVKEMGEKMKYKFGKLVKAVVKKLGETKEE